jgi:opacity protein-like surface antigen
MSISTLSKTGDIYDNEELKIAYTGGVFAQFHLKPSFTIQPELNYLCKGRSSDNENSEDATFHYLQIPVLAGYEFDLNKSLSAYLNAGPFVAPMLKSEYKGISGTEINSNAEGTDKKTDFGLILGGGILIPVNKVKIMVDLRYDLGLGKLNKQPDDFRTKALSLTTGIMF